MSRQHLSQVPGRAHRPDGRLEAGGGPPPGQGAGERREGRQAGEAGGEHRPGEEGEEDGGEKGGGQLLHH